MKANTNYTYILIENIFFINIEENPMKLFLILYRKTKPFQFFERKISIRIINWLPNSIIRILRVLQFTYQYYRAKKDPNLFSSLPKVTTQHYGQCLLKLRLGEIKIFNLKKEGVITEFQERVPISDIQERLSTLRQVTKIGPQLIEWKTEERYIVEKYINFKKSSFDFYNMKKSYLEVLPILENIRMIAKPKTIDLQVYINHKINCLESKVSILSNPDISVKVEKIRVFISFLKNALKGFDSNKEVLVPSHGDLWEGNILIKKGGFCIIDWDTLDYRSFYFDFFYFMFMLASKNKGFEKVDEKGISRLTKTLGVCFGSYYERLKESYNYNEHLLLKQSATYHYLFYLELIYLKLQAKYTIIDERVDEAVTWINRFECYEEKLLINNNSNL